MLIQLLWLIAFTPLMLAHFAKYNPDPILNALNTSYLPTIFRYSSFSESLHGLYTLTVLVACSVTTLLLALSWVKNDRQIVQDREITRYPVSE